MSSKTHNTGQLSGKLLVFGGPYSNLQSLQKMKEIADAGGFAPEQIICTGDVVGYCAQPEETVTLIREWGIYVICGNVEIQLREGEEDCGCDFNEGGRCDLFSRQWYPFAKEKLSEASIEWMKTLPEFIRLEFGGKTGMVVHGSYFETAGYVFASTDWTEKLRNFEAADADFILAGHCGLPFISEADGFVWFNPGVIGMPANEGRTRVWYGILEATSEGLEFRHHSYEYDHTTTARLMRENHLPEPYAKTLETGLWDNCEILPEVETAARGLEIEL